jgi:hypothetical protein
MDGLDIRLGVHIVSFKSKSIWLPVIYSPVVCLTEMDFWRRSARKSRKEKVRNVTIREVVELRKNILEVIEEKRLRWFGHVKRMPGNRLPLKVLEWEPEGTRRMGRPKERWIDGVRRSMTNHGLKEEDTRDRDRRRNLVLGEGKPLWSGQTIDE